MKIKVDISIKDTIETDEVVEIYKANNWSSAEKPEFLIPALMNSDTLVTARVEGKLVGIGNAISDGFLVVYYPHMLVHPNYQSQGVGKAMVECLQKKYESFHQQMLVAESKAVKFYKYLGFQRAGQTEPMWIYDGNDH